MPDCGALYLAELLFEIGPTLGEASITHTELAAWQRNTGAVLTPWEARMLKWLSREYMDESAHATDAARPSPWQEAPYARVNLQLVADSLKQSLKRMSNL